mgnify:CR=1 FL=1
MCNMYLLSIFFMPPDLIPLLSSICKDGKDGINGRDGRDGKDGKDGKYFIINISCRALLWFRVE